MRLVPLTVTLILLAFARVAAAQCTTCSPLSLPAGGAVSNEMQVAKGAGVALFSQVNTSWQSFPGQSVDGNNFVDPNRARIDAGILTLQTSVFSRLGFGGDVTLPVVWLAGTSVRENPSSVSLGDLELRARYTSSFSSKLTLFGALGTALPTGGYAARSGVLALSDSARSLTPGRGSVWGTVDAGVRVAPIDRLSLGAQGAFRAPFADAPDGFRWAPEVRAVLDVGVVIIKGWLVGNFATELAYRGISSGIDPFLGSREANTNTGGTVLALQPGVQVLLPKGLSVSVQARVPVWQRLDGLQFTQGVGLSVGLGWVVALGDARSEAPQAKNDARWRLTKYGATWCEACKTLDPIVSNIKARSPWLTISEVDVTDWTETQLGASLSTAAALPIVELRRPDGSLYKRLEGEATFMLAQLVDEVPHEN